MEPTPKRALTVEEFASTKQSDDWTEELIDGVVRRSRPPGLRHGEVCGNTAAILNTYRLANGFGRVAIGSGLIVAPDCVLAPDLQLFGSTRLPRTADRWPTVPPVLVIEVIDGPADYSHVMLKAPLYLRFGVDLLWLFRPALRDVRCYTLADQRTPFDRAAWSSHGWAACDDRKADATLTAEDVLPGFRCLVADFFA